jgi:hypothetical protein
MASHLVQSRAVHLLDLVKHFDEQLLAVPRREPVGVLPNRRDVLAHVDERVLLLADPAVADHHHHQQQQQQANSGEEDGHVPRGVSVSVSEREGA